ALARRDVWRSGHEVLVRDGRVDHLRPMLEFLLPAIVGAADVERPGLMAYLEQQGLDASGRCAVVDGGYSGTIQTRLNALVGGGVHGFYMATDRRVSRLPEKWGVRAEACFHERTEPAPNGPVFIRQSFAAEKLLSADSPQVVRYWLDAY